MCFLLSLQLQAALTGAISQGLNTAMINVTATVENDLGDALFQSLCCDLLADLSCGLDVAAETIEVLVHSGRRHQSNALLIVGLVQNLLGYESTDDMLAHLESSLEDYSKEALLYQAVAESLDITPTQEQLDAYSDYKDTYGQNYCTMVALMDAVTSTLTSGAVVS